jgi:hypothetical protein
MASVNDKFKGIGSELYSSTPEDIADANRALANSLGQIKSIFNVTPQQLATVGQSLETLKGLDKLDGKVIPAPDTIEYFKNTFADGSGQNGEYLLTDVVGTPAGWVHDDELAQEGPRLKEMESIGAMDNLVRDPGPYPNAPTNTNNGIYTVMKYHVLQNSYYSPYTDFTQTPPVEVPRWVIPAGLYGAGTYGTRDAALQALIDDANTEITAIASQYPLQASQSNTAYQNMANQLKREKETWAKVGITPSTTLAGTEQPIMQFVSNIHDYGNDTALGGKAWIFEQLANQNSRGGQAIIGAMREGRNIQRLSDAGIPTSLFRDQRDSTTEEATLQSSTYTVEEAKNSIDE